MNSLVFSKGYYNDICSFLAEHKEASVDLTNKKVEKIINLILSDQSLLKIDNFKIIPYITKILTLSSGRKVIKALINGRLKVSICITQGKNKFSPSTSTVHFNPEAKVFNILLNPKKEKVLLEVPRESCLVHELIHAFRQQYRLGTTKEEFETITGITESSSGVRIDPFCENTFLIAWGYGPRVNHVGVALNDDELLTLIDYVLYDAIGNIAKILEDDCNLINIPQESCLLKQETGNKTAKSPKLLPLTASIISGNKTLFRDLIKQGADPRLIDDFGSLLHSAIRANSPNLDIVKMLIDDFGAKVDIKNQQGLTPLMLLVKLLCVSEKTNFESSLLPILKFLVSKSDLSLCNEVQDPLLIQAIKYKGIETFKELIKLGVLPSCCDQNGNTPFMIAIQQGYSVAQLEKILEMTSKDLNLQNNCNQTPMHFALLQGDSDVVIWLANNGFAIPDDIIDDTNAILVDCSKTHQPKRFKKSQ